MGRTFSDYFVHYLLNPETQPLSSIRVIHNLTIPVKEVLEIPDYIPSFCVGWRHFVLRRGSDLIGGKFKVPDDSEILASTGFSYLGELVPISKLGNTPYFETFTSTGEDRIGSPNPDYRTGHAVRTIGEVAFELGPYDRAVDIDRLMHIAA